MASTAASCTVVVSFESTEPRPQTQPSARSAANGAWVHLLGSAGTTSRCESSRIGCPPPVPRSRRTTLPRPGAESITCASSPAARPTSATYSAGGRSLPGGLVVSNRTSAWRWRTASSSIVRSSAAANAIRLRQRRHGDLDARASWQCAHADGRPTGRVHLEVLGVDLVHLAELGKVGHVDERLDRPVEATAGLLQDVADVLERLARLGRDAARDDLAGARVDALLAGHEDEA